MGWLVRRFGAVGSVESERLLCEDQLSRQRESQSVRGTQVFDQGFATLAEQRLAREPARRHVGQARERRVIRRPGVGRRLEGVTGQHAIDSK
jgi:hypothetical protein